MATSDTAAGQVVTCSCAHHNDGSTTTMMCPQHASDDPCLTMATVTGRRRRGSIIDGTCTTCGWSAPWSRKATMERGAARNAAHLARRMGRS